MHYSRRRGGLIIPKGFTEIEKITIAELLQSACKAQWQTRGYKRTSVEVLCIAAGISKGAFYLFFTSKEQLFLETLQRTRTDLYALMRELVRAKPDEVGITRAMKAAYLAYSESTFLYDTQSADYMAFVEHLNASDKMLAQGDISQCIASILREYQLSVRIDVEILASELALLLLSIANKNQIPCEHAKVFDEMLAHAVEDIG